MVPTTGWPSPGPPAEWTVFALFHPFQESPMSIRSWTRSAFASSATRPRRIHLAVEALEDRCVLSTTTLTNVVPSLSESVYGQALTFTASVSAPGGTALTGSVQFAVDGQLLGSPVAVSGSGEAMFPSRFASGLAGP